MQCIFMLVIYTFPAYSSISPNRNFSTEQCNTAFSEERRGVVLKEVLTSPSCGALSDRGRRTCPD